MLEVYERLGTQSRADIDDVVVLTSDQRERGRLKLTSVTGQEVRVFLDRGKTLLVGELLKATNGQHVLVQGALEDVCMAHCRDWQTFARACYHLGNRHVKVQVGELWLRMKPDHVLEDMLLGLGLETQHQQAVFIAENGAYTGGGHAHLHAHVHSHTHSNNDPHHHPHSHS